MSRIPGIRSVPEAVERWQSGRTAAPKPKLSEEQQYWKTVYDFYYWSAFAALFTGRSLGAVEM